MIALVAIAGAIFVASIVAAYAVGRSFDFAGAPLRIDKVQFV